MKQKKKPKNIKSAVTDEEWRIANAQVKANAIVFGDRPRDTDSSIARMHLLPLSSFFNHSCRPNAAFAINEEGTGRAAVKTIEDIKAGEEITVCYHSELLYLPTKKRQAQLKDSHKFECQCARCSAITPSENDVFIKQKLKPVPVDDLKKLRSTFKALVRLKQAFQTEKEAKLLEKLCTEFLNTQPLHFCHWRMYQIRDACIYATISLFGMESNEVQRKKRQTLLYSLLEAQMLTQEKILPQFHPDKLPVIHAYQKYKEEEKLNGPGDVLTSRKMPIPSRYQSTFDQISKIFATE